MTDRILRGADRRSRLPLQFPLQEGAGLAVTHDRRGGIDRRTLGFVSRLAIFHGISYAAVEDIVSRCDGLDLASGELLLAPGQQSTFVGIVLSGRLHVRLEGDDTRDAIDIGPGESVGELSVIDGVDISAHVVAVEPTRLLTIGRDVFLNDLLAVPGISRNLMATLAQRMRRGNERIVERLRARLELERLQGELRFANEIQRSMLPQQRPLFPERRDIDAAGTMVPAREVGGDFFDAFFIDSHRLFMTVGDVCGKGMPAALFMVRSLTQLRIEANRRGGDAASQVRRIAQRLNAALTANNEARLFVSAFCAILDVQSGRLAYANAGHNPPLVAFPGVGARPLTEPRNPVAGLLDGVDFRVGEIFLPPGSRLVLYTDGIIEAEDDRQSLYGEERLKETLDRCRKTDVSSTLDAVVADVARHTNGHPASDDLTLLVVDLVGNEA